MAQKKFDRIIRMQQTLKFNPNSTGPRVPIDRIGTEEFEENHNIKDVKKGWLFF